MIAWKAQLKPIEIAQVASYVLTFQGTTPANPKDAEGDLWGDATTQAPAESETTPWSCPVCTVTCSFKHKLKRIGIGPETIP